MRSIPFFLLAAWLCLSLGAYAQTPDYYVGPNGLDAPASGTQATPFATIGYAVAQQKVTNGDVIQVLAGTYQVNQTILVNKSLTITGLGGEVKLSSDSSPLISITAGDVTIAGLSLSPSSDALGNGVGIFIETPTSESTNVTIQQNTISNFTSAVEIALGRKFNTLAISNNFITNNTNGILINNNVQFTGNSAVSRNDLSANTNSIVNNNSTNLNSIINAQANWWGVQAASDVTNMINNVVKVDYSPWLIIEDDNDGNTEGFQASLEKIGSRRTPSNTNALTDAYNLVDADGQIWIYASTDPNNLKYESLTVNKNLSLLNRTNTTISVTKFTTENGGNLEITGPFKADGLELKDGDITMISNALTLSSNGVIIEEGTSKFYGEARSTGLSIPANQTFSLLGLTFSPANGNVGLQNVTVSRTTGPNAVFEIGQSESIAVRWNITVPNQNNISPRDLTFSWESVYDNGMQFPATDAIVWKREDENSSWVPEAQSGITVDPDNNTRQVTVDGVNSFSEWIISDVSNPLPVVLTSFSAALSEPHVELDWETASEINSDFFSVERSENGKDFQEIGKLKAAGDSDKPLQYRYIDEQVTKRFSGSLFYRLRTVDFDGSFEYSDITLVNISEDDIPMITAFARQGEGIMKLFTRAIEPGDYHIWITDLSGRKIFEQDIQLASKEVYEIGVGKLPQSVYLIRCVGKQLALSTKFRIEEVN